MAKKSRRGSAAPGFLRHSNLVAAEALLLVSVIKDFINDFIKSQPASTVPNWGKVLFLMAATVGVLGVFFAVLEKATKGGVARTHDVVQALPIPAPVLAIHAAVLVGLFYLYAHLQHLPVWPLVGG